MNRDLRRRQSNIHPKIKSAVPDDDKRAMNQVQLITYALLGGFFVLVMLCAYSFEECERVDAILAPNTVEDYDSYT